MAMEIVSFPINSMVIFHSYVSLPEGKWIYIDIDIHTHTYTYIYIYMYIYIYIESRSEAPDMSQVPAFDRSMRIRVVRIDTWFGFRMER